MIRSKASFTQVRIYGVGLHLSPEVCAFVLLLAIKVLAGKTPSSAKGFAHKDYMPSAFLGKYNTALDSLLWNLLSKLIKRIM